MVDGDDVDFFITLQEALLHTRSGASLAVVLLLSFDCSDSRRGYQVKIEARKNSFGGPHDVNGTSSSLSRDSTFLIPQQTLLPFATASGRLFGPQPTHVTARL